MMRGSDGMQEALFTVVKLDGFVPPDHPLRAIRELVNQALSGLRGLFNTMYADSGRASVAPEKLLRAMLIQVLFSVRSERQLMEQVRYNLLYRWFIGLAIDDAVWDHSVFSKTAGSGQKRRPNLGRREGAGTPRHHSARWIPALEVSDILSVEDSASHLQERVRPHARPLHVPITFHALTNDVVDNGFSSSTRERLPICPAPLIVDQMLCAGLQIPNESTEGVVCTGPAGGAADRLQALQASRTLTVPEQPLGTHDASLYRSSHLRADTPQSLNRDEQMP